ncbi:glycosyltransferase family 4 protein [Dyadobacter crusticola]|uniref:glycosyltransferase family 4 protein n=1 Tax=Dyadobacter crusticola TaxID=292407 RepID=UPI0004E1FE0C|nr:glycosyltransferase family 4 protein [Dyadobacter crusticola]
MESRKTILHISEVDITLTGGMGRVAHYWKNAFENAGYNFIHLGPKEIGKVSHKSLFSWKAYRYMQRQGIKATAIIVHEPAALFFVNQPVPVFIESHGIESRNWERELKSGMHSEVSFKTRLLYPVWRLWPCKIGLKAATKLLLINNEDKLYAQKKFKRSEEDIYVFKNGADLAEASSQPERFTVLFNGSWIKRKGYEVLIESARLLIGRGILLNYLLIGTGKREEDVLADWPAILKPFVQVVPAFPRDMEAKFLNDASIVVLPSNFEGQPLSILQAMAAGKCCITTNCCGQKDFIENGKTGFLFEPCDAEALAGLIADCIADEHLIQKIGAAAKAAVADRTWERVSSEVVQYVTDHIC